MKAITLRQHWAMAVMLGWKPLENRKTRLRCVQPGERIAIHCAKGYEPTVQDIADVARRRSAAIGIVRDRTGRVPESHRAANRDLLHALQPFDDEQYRGRVLCTVVYDGPHTEFDELDPWFTGPHAWRLRDVERLPVPLHAKGKQGIWDWEVSRGA